jgi:hydroxymethylbilane synthase
MDARPLRLGTRGSRLALAQSTLVADRLRGLGADVELMTIRTAGDQRAPDTAWGEGAFVGALEQALLDGTVDLAVHSAKDVPTTQDPNLAIAAFPEREDPRDALVCRDQRLTLESLPAGGRVGTDSPRRTAFLLARRPDLRVHPLHGNVDTRLARLDAGETDALVLAVAGLTRLGRAERISEILPADLLPPAPGQGSLAVQVRADDELTRWYVSQLDDPATCVAVETERAFLRASGGGCRAPIGALAYVAGDDVVLTGGSAGTSETPTAGLAAGARPVVAWGSARGPGADRWIVASNLAATLTAQLERRVPGRAPRPADRPRVLVTRAGNQAAPLIAALESAEIETYAVATFEILPVEVGGPLDEAVGSLEAYDWVVVTSVNGAAVVADALGRLGADRRCVQWAAVGPATAARLAERGISVALAAVRSNGEGLAADLPLLPGDRILLPRADIADTRVPDLLRARGATVDEVVAYRTVEAPSSSRVALRAAFADGPFSAIVFASGSAIRGLLGLLTPAERRIALRSTACCIGPTTARVARESGFAHVAEASAQSAAALAELVAGVTGTVEAVSAG